MTKTQQSHRMRAEAVWVVGVALALLVSGCAAQNGGAPQPAAVADPQTTSQAPTPTPTPTPTPVTTTKLVLVDEPLPFGATTVNDPNAAVGTQTVTTAGVAGVRTKTYRVTLRDGVEVGRTLTANVVSRPPIDQVTTVGTLEPSAAAPAPPAGASGCDPNYSGCVPIASDVDCAGGSGNGPAYVQGPVQVIGTDVYDLDRDGDGVACD
jgi:hypothetical protein